MATPVSSRSRTVSTSVSSYDCAARQVLNNQELASLIISFFDSLENPRDDNKKALARLCTLNRSFFHASTDAFWRQLPSLSPFLRLLPLCPGDDKGESEAAIASVQADPWARFRVYNRKTVQIDLSDDKTIGKVMPNHWFFCLLHQPTRPAVLFPKLANLFISSVAGLNSVIPMHVSKSLRMVNIRDFTIKGKYDGLKEVIMTSFMATLATNASALSSLSIRAPLTSSMTASFPHFRALKSLEISFASPLRLEQLASINSIPNLKTLTLLSRGPATAVATWPVPAEGQHLINYHAAQGKASLIQLNVIGDGCFIFWATVFFACPTLTGYSAKVIVGFHQPIHTVFLYPHALDIVAKRCSNIQQIGMEWDEPAENMDTELESFEDEPGFRTPPTLFHSFSKLVNLEFLDIKNVPFISQDFSLQLVSHMSELKRLARLRILPRPLTNQPHHNLILPTLDALQDFAVNNPRLQYLSLFSNISVIPQADNVTIPDSHSIVRKLFITPRYRPMSLPVPDIVALAMYLDKLFPALQDITSYFEPGKGGDVPVPTSRLKLTPLALWKNVDSMLKSFQSVRRKYAPPPAVLSAAATPAIA
ncbi:hypothetical protein D9611_010816 [Ephemerocybe angulata]|uniref:F-box domain-containing protein n=1 Tax=Ephemerocybe angulata TaxID=980116 RepID=A0A8H5F1U1_9AGAR|nr:hypothetical protein D9611_010816 [Tulosesus angulatus]